MSRKCWSSAKYAFTYCFTMSACRITNGKNAVSAVKLTSDWYSPTFYQILITVGWVSYLLLLIVCHRYATQTLTASKKTTTNIMVTRIRTRQRSRWVKRPVQTSSLANINLEFISTEHSCELHAVVRSLYCKTTASYSFKAIPSVEKYQHRTQTSGMTDCHQ